MVNEEAWEEVLSLIEQLNFMICFRACCNQHLPHDVVNCPDQDPYGDELKSKNLARPSAERPQQTPPQSRLIQMINTLYSNSYLCDYRLLQLTAMHGHGKVVQERLHESKARYTTDRRG